MMLRTGWLLTALLLGPALQLAAQLPRTVTGVVTDSAGTPLPGAAVVALTGGTAVHTGPDGAFRLDLPAGTSTLLAARVGYRPDTVAVDAAARPLVIRLAEAALSIEAVTVRGERSFAASGSTAIRELDLHLRPRRSSQELLRLVPGLVIAQHGGGGKAEQIFLRGFDADHGTDVAIVVDGLPVNMVSHAHGQGYADLHFVIPELVERVEVRKGPFDPRDGDFATAGAVHFRTRERLTDAVASVRAGSFGTAHLFAAAPLGGAGQGGGYLALAGLRSDGPFEAAQDHRRLNLVGRWTAPLGPAASWYARASGFGAAWNASGQIPDRVVRAGALGRFGALDPSEGGATHRQDLSVGARSSAARAEQWEAQLFATRYGFRLFSNFTFFRDDPEEGDGIEQVDERSILGFRGAYGRPNRVVGRDGRWQAGLDLRLDQAEVTLHHQRERVRLRARVDNHLAQAHLSGWMEQQLALRAGLRASLGVRADLFQFDVLDRLAGVESDRPHATGTASAGIVSPRLNLAWDAGERTTLFASVGSGFHSNDARDVVLAAAGERVLPRAVSSELGARTAGSRGSFAASLWALALQSELVYVGDEGVTEASGRTRRLGLDLEGRLHLAAGLWADADLNLSRGRFPDQPAGADLIPLAPTLTSTGGLTARDLGPLTGGVRYRHISARPADETGSIQADGSTIWELFGSFTRARWEVSVTVDNLLDASWNEAQFATTSRLRHEPEAVTGLHFTPGAPRSLLVGLTYRF